MAHDNLAALVDEVRRAAADIASGDTRTNARIDILQKALDTVLFRLNRPGPEGAANDNVDERKEASDFCILRRNVTIPKSDGSNVVYLPSPAEIDEARSACRGLRNLWRLS